MFVTRLDSLYICFSAHCLLTEVYRVQASGLLWMGDSPTPKLLPDNTHNSQETDILASSGIKTRNPSKRPATDIRARPPGRWDLQSKKYTQSNYKSVLDIPYVFTWRWRK
jgi:hypothetical protein